MEVHGNMSGEETAKHQAVLYPLSVPLDVLWDILSSKLTLSAESLLLPSSVMLL